MIGSSNVTEVIRAFQTFLFFFYQKILQAQKTQKAQKTEKAHKKHKNAKRCLFGFCSFICVFVLFVRVKSFCKKKIKRSKLPQWPHLHYYWVKSYFYRAKNLPAIFTGSKQSKTPFGRNFVTYGTPCHARGHFVFLLSPCYLQDTLPC